MIWLPPCLRTPFLARAGRVALGLALILLAGVALPAAEVPKPTDAPPAPVIRADSPSGAEVVPPAPSAVPDPAARGVPSTSPLAAAPATNTSGSETSPVASPEAALNALEALDNKHRLAVGDRISFRIVEDEEDAKPLVVTDLGDLEIPYVGRFPVVGKTCRELARLLKTELEKEYYYQASVVISVDVMARSRGKVYLVGPVRSPGPLELPSDEVLTVSKAILRAGGFGDFADRKRVKITRRSAGTNQADLTIVVDVAEILEKGKREADLALEPGDLIYIPERLVRF